MRKKLTSILLSVVMTLTMVTTMPFNFQSVAQGNATKENSDTIISSDESSNNQDEFVPTIQSETITAEQVEFNSEPVVASQPANGTGTIYDPYQLTTAAELLWFANTVNNGNMNIHAKLMADIDLSSVCSPELGSWKPISSNYSASFDGNRHVIKNLYINSTEDNQGLFGEIDRATITYLGLVNCNITGADYVGGLVGNSGYAGVANCFVTGSVTGNENVGGIYGFCSCSYPTDDISAAKVSGNTNVGVICGTLGGACSHSVGIKTENVPLFGNMLSYAKIDNVVEMDDLSTGEACYFMNGNSGVFPTWYQNTGVGGDELPVFDSTHGIVYKTDDGYSMCKDHSSLTDGFCKVCGKFIADGLTPNAEGVYEIDTAKKLLWFSYYVNNVNLGANAKLTENIDLSSVCGKDIGNWIPIGQNNHYTGCFDGNGKTISNLYINSDNDYLGLFGSIDKTGVVSNVNINNADVTGTNNYSYIGGLCGSLYGNMSHCSVSGKVTGSVNRSNIGGLCGRSYFGTISDCCNNATVSVTGYSNSVGGVCGNNYSAYYSYNDTINIGTVKGCFNTGSVTASVTETDESNNVGPLIGIDDGSNYSVVTDNYYLGTEETDSLEGTTFKTEAQFKSGEVAYLLNNGVTDGTQVWYQTCELGYPDFSGETVYEYTDCSDNVCYSNTLRPSGHNYVNGVCSACGGYTQAVLITTENHSDYGFTDSTYDGYYAIYNLGSLMWFSDYAITNQTAKAVLVDDISIDNNKFKPIGTDIEFNGTFDGNGHTVTFNITNSDTSLRYGIFATISGGSISNIKLEGNITSDKGWSKAGALAGAAYATPITNVTSTVNIENKMADSYTGGLVGYFGGREKAIMSNCSVDSDVTGTLYVGGLIGAGWEGTQYYTIKNCLYIGDVISTTESQSVGAVVGASLTNKSSYYNLVVIDNVYYCCSASSVGTWPSTEINAAAQINKVNSVTSSELESGEVALMLQNGCTETTWGQSATDLIPVLTNDDNLLVKSIVFKYNDKTKTSYIKYGNKISFPEPLTDDGSSVLYWAKPDGSPFRVTESFASGLELTAVMSYTKLAPVTDSNLAVDRTNSIISNEPVFNGTTVEDYKDSFKNDASLVVIEDANGNVLSDTALVGTGCVIKSLSEFDGKTVIDSLTVVVMGDLNGDGLINDDDYNVLKNNINDCNLNGAYHSAADIYKDGAIDAFDLYLMSLSNCSVNGKLKYNVTSEQTLTDLQAKFGEDCIVYNAQGVKVTDSTELLGTGTKIVYQRNGITITQNLVVA